MNIYNNRGEASGDYDEGRADSMGYVDIPIRNSSDIISGVAIDHRGLQI